MTLEEKLHRAEDAVLKAQRGFERAYLRMQRAARRMALCHGAIISAEKRCTRIGEEIERALTEGVGDYPFTDEGG